MQKYLFLVWVSLATCFKLQAQLFQHFPLADVKTVSEMYQDQKGDIWFYETTPKLLHDRGLIEALNTGLVHYDGQNMKTHQEINQLKLKNGFHKPVEDTEGNLYLASPDRGYVLKYQNGSFTNLTNTERGFVTNLLQSPDNQISISLHSKQSAYGNQPLTIKNGQLAPYPDSLIYFGTSTEVLAGLDGNMYLKGGINLGNHLGVVQFNATKPMQVLTNEKFIGDMLVDKEGALWVGGLEGDVYRFDENNPAYFKIKALYFNSDVAFPGYYLGIIPGIIIGLAIDDYAALTQLAEGEDRIWCVSRDYRLGYIQNEQLHIIDKASGIKKPKRAYDVFVDREGRVWVPKQKKGLSMYDGRRWYNYTRKDGLPQKCYNVSQDREGNIWVMGKKGISRFNS